MLSFIAAANIALGLLAPWPIKLVVDNILGNKPWPAALAPLEYDLAGGSQVALLIIVVFGGLVLQILTQVVSIANTQCQVDTGQRMAYALRSRLPRTSRRCHCVTTSSRARLIRYTGSRPTRTACNDLVMSGFFGLCTAVLTLAAMFVVLLRLDSSLALLSLAVVPPLFICLRYYAQRMVDRAQGVKELESKLIERMYEILWGSRW